MLGGLLADPPLLLLGGGEVGLGPLQPDLQVRKILCGGRILVAVLLHILDESLPELALILGILHGGVVFALLCGDVDLGLLDIPFYPQIIGTDLGGDLVLLSLSEEGGLILPESFDVLLDQGYVRPETVEGGLLVVPEPVDHLGIGDVQILLGLEIHLGLLTVLLECTDLPLLLGTDDVYALQIGGRLGPLPLRLVYVRIETGDAGYPVQDASPLDVAHLDDVRDVPLLHDVVPVGAYPRLGEEGVELGEGGFLVVDEEIRCVVGTVLGELDVTRQYDRVVIPGHDTVAVVEHQRDLHELGLRLGGPAVEDEVRDPARPHRLGAPGPQYEKDGVRYVRLT